MRTRLPSALLEERFMYSPSQVESQITTLFPMLACLGLRKTYHECVPQYSMGLNKWETVQDLVLQSLANPSPFCLNSQQEPSPKLPTFLTVSVKMTFLKIFCVLEPRWLSRQKNTCHKSLTTCIPSQTLNKRREQTRNTCHTHNTYMHTNHYMFLF